MAARNRFDKTWQDGYGNVLVGVAVSVCNFGTSTPVSPTMYAGDTGGAALANPLASDSFGYVQAYFNPVDAATLGGRVTLVPTLAGYNFESAGYNVDLAIPQGGPVIFAAAREQLSQGANVASVNNMTLGLDGNCFVITGSTQVNLLDTTGWQNGSVATLLFSTGTNIVVKNNFGNSGAFHSFYLSGAADFTTANNNTLTVQLIAGNWFELARGTA